MEAIKLYFLITVRSLIEEILTSGIAKMLDKSKEVLNNGDFVRPKIQIL